MAFSSILRQISYSFNTNFLLVNFAFVKIIKLLKGGWGGGGGEHRPPLDPPLLSYSISSFGFNYLCDLCFILSVLFCFVSYLFL